MRGFLFAVLAAICWGLAPVAAKMALHNTSSSVAMGFRSLVAASIFCLWFLATGRYRLMMEVPIRPAGWLLLEALLATVVGDLFYFFAIKHGEAGQISLIMASSPLVTLFTAMLILGETIDVWKMIGAILVVGGLILIGV